MAAPAPIRAGRRPLPRHRRPSMHPGRSDGALDEEGVAVRTRAAPAHDDAAGRDVEVLAVLKLPARSSTVPPKLPERARADTRSMAAWIAAASSPPEGLSVSAIGTFGSATGVRQQRTGETASGGGPRKNWLFAGSIASLHRAALLYSLVQSCRLVGVDPVAYFCDVLLRVAHPHTPSVSSRQKHGLPASPPSSKPIAYRSEPIAHTVAGHVF